MLSSKGGHFNPFSTYTEKMEEGDEGWEERGGGKSNVSQAYNSSTALERMLVICLGVNASL